MKKKGAYSVPYMFDDDEMQTRFHKQFFIRPIAFGRSFEMENFLSLPHIIEAFEFQGWNDFLRISEDVYTGVVATFYSTVASVDEDNPSIKSIVVSFKIQVLPSDLAHITNTQNEGVLCRGGTKWWEQLEVSEEEVSEVLTGRHDM